MRNTNFRFAGITTSGSVPSEQFDLALSDASIDKRQALQAEADVSPTKIGVLDPKVSNKVSASSKYY